MKRRLRLRALNASCSSCLLAIKKELERKEGVIRVAHNALLDLILVDYDTEATSEQEILKEVSKTGYKVVKYIN